VVVERLVGVAYHLAIAIGLMLLVHRMGARSSIAAGATAALVFLSFTPVAYAWLGGLALLVWSLALLDRASGWRVAVLAGVVGGLVPLWRPEMGVLLLAAVPIAVQGRHVGPYLGGLMAGLGPLLAHLAVAGTDTWRNVVVGRIGNNSQTSLSNVAPINWLVLALCLAGLILIGCRAMAADSRLRGLHRTLAIAGTLMLPQALQRTDIFHTSFVACVILPATAAAVVNWAPTMAWPSEFLRRAAVGVAVAAVAGISAISAAHPAAIVSNSGRELPLDAESAGRLARIIGSVHRHVPVGSRVFVGSQDMSRVVAGDVALYHLMPEYRHNFYFVELAPGVAEKAGSRLVDDVESTDALVLTYLDPAVLDLDLPHIERGDQQVNAAVRSGFCLVDTVETTQLWLRGTC
jgi:hypothetical protein